MLIFGLAYILMSYGQSLSFFSGASWLLLKDFNEQGLNYWETSEIAFIFLFFTPWEVFTPILLSVRLTFVAMIPKWEDFYFLDSFFFRFWGQAMPILVSCFLYLLIVEVYLVKASHFPFLWIVFGFVEFL